MAALNTQKSVVWEKKVFTVLHAPGLKGLAEGVAKHLGSTLVHCISNMMPMPSETGLCWDSFPSGDPNLKLRIDAIKGKHVVLLMNHDTAHLFEQLAVLLFLQRFVVPHPEPEYAAGKWKRTMRDGRYDECYVASLTVIVPWYRHCQMERTCRWTVTEQGKWYNGEPHGEFVDVPTAQSFAAMLSSLPIPGSSKCPPQQLLLVDIHEYEDLQFTLDSTHRWANKKQEYDYVRGTGTYFTSAFEHFLSRVHGPSLEAVGSAFVVFPDNGAHARFYTMVHTSLKGVPLENILWINKSRVGTDITQTDALHYIDANGREQQRTSGFANGARILIADDFTNSGGACSPSHRTARMHKHTAHTPPTRLLYPQPRRSETRPAHAMYAGTLFGAAEIVRGKAAPGAKLHVSCFVSHFVATYSKDKVAKFVEKLYAPNAPLDEFNCTDSIPNVVQWLTDELDSRVAKGAPRKAKVMTIAPVLAEWVTSHPLGPPYAKPRPSFARPRGLTPSGRRRYMNGVGLRTTAVLVLGAVALGVALGRRMR